MNFRNVSEGFFCEEPMFGRVAVAVPQQVRIGVQVMPVGIPVGIPVNAMPVGIPVMRKEPSFRQPTPCGCRSHQPQTDNRPLCMEVTEDGASRVVQSNKRLTPSEMDFHMNRFNKMRHEQEFGSRVCNRPIARPRFDEDEDELEDLIVDILERILG